MGWNADMIVGSIEPFLLCSICFDVMMDASQCENQHAACAECLEGLNECPQCRCSLGNMTPARLVRHIVEETLMIRCEHEGCSEVLKINFIVSHQRTCGFRMMTCPNNHCDALFAANNLSNHLQLCAYQVVQCTNPGCVHQTRRILMNRHLSECTYRVVQCPNERCGFTCSLKLLDDHITKECGYALIPCPLNCGVSVLRKEIEEHYEVCDKFIVMCPNQGCSTRIERHDTAKHRDSCKHEIIKCTNMKCSQMLKRAKLMEHRCLECNFEMLLCNQNGCTEVVPRVELKDHIESRCLHTLTACPVPNCNTKTQRKMMNAHIKTCGHVKIVCPNSSLGCEVQVERCAMNEHCFTCKYRLVTCTFCSSSVVQHELDMHTQGCPEFPVICETCGMSETRSCSQKHECISSLQKEIMNLKEIFDVVSFESFESMILSACSNGNERFLASLLDLDQCVFDKNRDPSKLHCFQQQCLGAAFRSNNHQVVNVLLDKKCIQICDIQELFGNREMMDWLTTNSVIREKLQNYSPTAAIATTNQEPQQQVQLVKDKNQPVGVPISIDGSKPTYIPNSMGRYLFKDTHGRWAVQYGSSESLKIKSATNYWLLKVCSRCGYAKPDFEQAVSGFFPKFSAEFDVPENQPKFTCGRCKRGKYGSD